MTESTVDPTDGRREPVVDVRYLLSSSGVFEPPFEVTHSDAAYDPVGFEVLADMQERHFWYRGRHRLLLARLRRAVAAARRPLAAVDLGGGCGAWAAYLTRYDGRRFSEIAVADTSIEALRVAGQTCGDHVTRYHADVTNLGWNGRWDVAFLLDVIEHLPDDTRALREARTALVPGGLLFVTAPALQVFWSYNDRFAGHYRRYSVSDLERRARDAGFAVLHVQYFMFFTAPLLWLSRRFRRCSGQVTAEQARTLMKRTHRTPSPPVNTLLTAILAVEERIGRFVHYPFGTSLLAVLRKEA